MSLSVAPCRLLLGTNPIINFSVRKAFHKEKNNMLNVRLCRFGLLVTIATICQAQTWTQLSPTGGPPTPRESPIALDPPSGRLITFGSGDNASGKHTKDVWVLTNANGLESPQWIQLAPNPDPVNGFPQGRLSAMVYDPISNRMIIMDGCLSHCLPVATDLW